jgi:multidrug efflux pump subunit AcrA (membrane-fusion protein)
VRIVAEVPEADFGVVAPSRPVRIAALATNRELHGTIARRSPAADLSTRTIHLEVDVPDPERTLPVGTTAEIALDVGEPVRATEIPLVAASVRGNEATVFVVDHDLARKGVYLVQGERGGRLFVEPALRPGSRVVTEGRALLRDGDRVEAQLEAAPDGGTKVAGIGP